MLTYPHTVAVGASSTVLVNGVGQLGTLVSSRRFKHDIAAMADDSASIYNLNPVTFAYNGDASETRQYGLIAEEVDEVMPSIVVKDENGQPYTVQYQVLPVLMLNELQKQHGEIREQREMFEERISRLEQTLKN